MISFIVGFDKPLEEYSGWSSVVHTQTEHFDISKGANYYWIHCRWCDISFAIRDTYYRATILESQITNASQSERIEKYLFEVFFKYCPPEKIMEAWFGSLTKEFRKGRAFQCEQIKDVLNFN